MEFPTGDHRDDGAQWNTTRLCIIQQSILLLDLVVSSYVAVCSARSTVSVRLLRADGQVLLHEGDRQPSERGWREELERDGSSRQPKKRFREQIHVQCRGSQHFRIRRSALLFAPVCPLLQQPVTRFVDAFREAAKHHTVPRSSFREMQKIGQIDSPLLYFGIAS